MFGLSKFVYLPFGLYKVLGIKNENVGFKYLKLSINFG